MVSYPYISKNVFFTKKPSFILWYLSFLFIILLSLYLLIFNFQYDLNYSTKGIIIYDEKYYLKLYIDIKNLNKVVQSNILAVDNKKYPYKIIDISSEIMVDNNNLINYKEVLVECSLPSNKLIKNNIIDLNINYKKTLLVEIIYNFITGKEN